MKALNTKIIFTIFSVSMAFTGQSAKLDIDDINQVTNLSQLSRDIELPEDPQQSIDTLVFFAPAYADKLGGNHRVVEKLFETFNKLNDLNTEQGFHKQYRLVSVSPYKVNVPEGTPWFGYTDENGERQRGVDSIIQNATFSEFEGEEEYLFRQYFMPDMVYTTKHYEGERFLGTAANAVTLSVNLGELNYGSGTVLDTTYSPDTSFNTWAHEFGHNWGAGHEISDYDTPREEVRGHAYQCSTSRTIMWSSGGSNLYSNPDISMDGEACGDADLADNHAVISENVVIAPNLVMASETTGEVNFLQPSLTIDEGQDAIIEVTREGDLSVSTRVTVVVWPQTAEYNVDYTGGFYEVMFEKGQDTAQVVLDILSDATPEADEQIKAQLLFPGRMKTGSQDEMIITINGSNEGGNIGNFALTQDRIRVTEGMDIPLTIERIGGSDGQVIINVERVLDTAGISDVGSLPASVLFDVGETVKTIQMKTLQDSEIEEDELVVVKISSVADVTVSETNITIRDDDSGIIEKGEFSLEDVPSSVVEGGEFSFYIERVSGDGDAELVLEIDYSNNSADSNETISMSGEEVSKIITVNIPDNIVDEPDYSVMLTLSTKDDGVYFGTNGVSVAVTDNDTISSSEQSIGSENSTSGGSLFILLWISSALLTKRLFISVAFSIK